MLLLIIVLLLLFCGGGGYYGYSRWGGRGGLGIVGRSCLSRRYCTCSASCVDLVRIDLKSRERRCVLPS
jgi:hypothetical protein